MKTGADALAMTSEERKVAKKIRLAEKAAKQKQNTAKFRRSSAVTEANTVDVTVIDVTTCPVHDGVTSSSKRVSERQIEATKEEKEDFAKDWKRIAEICDRLFFYLFLFAFVITTLILFHPLTIPVRTSVLTAGPH